MISANCSGDNMAKLLIGQRGAALGVFGTVALATDVTAVRLLLLLAVAYAVVRLTFSLIRA